MTMTNPDQPKLDAIAEAIPTPMHGHARGMNGKEWLLLVVLSVLWGGSFFFIGVAVKELPPLTIVASRLGIGAMALLLVARLFVGAMPRERRVWLAFAGMGVLNNAIPFTLIVWGQTQIASGLASILNATTPLFTVAVAHLLTSDEKLTPQRLFGLVAGIAGVSVMIGGDAVAGLGSAVWAQLAVLGAALSYGFASVFGRRFRSMGLTPLHTAAGQVSMSSLLLIPAALLIDRPWSLPVPSGEAIASVVALALVSTALAYLIFFRILATAGATNLSLVTFLIPVSAIMFGVLLLGETLYARHLAGMALIGLGLAAIDGRPWQLLAGPHRSGVS